MHTNRLLPSMALGRTRRAGFTLVEILVVIVLLGILAAIVIPQFTSASEESRENSLKMNLYRIRQQLELYKQHHRGDWPSVQNFKQQMTMASDAQGNTAEPGTEGFHYGPYLRELPVNPFTGGDEVANAPVGESDWYYNPNTGDFHANDTEEHREW